MNDCIFMSLLSYFYFFKLIQTESWFKLNYEKAKKLMYIKKLAFQCFPLSLLFSPQMDSELYLYPKHCMGPQVCLYWINFIYF